MTDQIAQEQLQDDLRTLELGREAREIFEGDVFAKVFEELFVFSYNRMLEARRTGDWGKVQQATTELLLLHNLLTGLTSIEISAVQVFQKLYGQRMEERALDQQTTDAIDMALENTLDL